MYTFDSIFSPEQFDKRIAKPVSYLNLNTMHIICSWLLDGSQVRLYPIEWASICWIFTWNCAERCRAQCRARMQTPSVNSQQLIGTSTIRIRSNVRNESAGHLATCVIALNLSHGWNFTCTPLLMLILMMKLLALMMFLQLQLYQHWIVINSAQISCRYMRYRGHCLWWETHD